MKIELPENQSEITLGQFQELAKLNERTDLDLFEYSKRKVKIFTGLSYVKISAMKQTDLEEIINQIDTALNEEAKFQPLFKMNEIEFGFIPNFDDIKANEYFDLSTYDREIETLHKLMAILFRPVKFKTLGKYEIVRYKGTKEHAEEMKQMPLSIVNGALFFFLNLAKDLSNYIQKSINQEQEKRKQSGTLKSGDGMPRFTEWLKGSFGSLKRSVN
jgi:hypothetical protein